MSDFAGMGMSPGGVMLPGAMPQEVKDRMVEESKRQCRVVAINTVNFLVEKGIVEFGSESSDPNKDKVQEYLSLVNKVARYVDTGVTQGG